MDGLHGPEAAAATKRLASLLAKKWNRVYSELVGYVWSQLSVALVRSTSRCIRADRDLRPGNRHRAQSIPVDNSPYPLYRRLQLPSLTSPQSQYHITYQHQHQHQHQHHTIIANPLIKHASNNVVYVFITISTPIRRVLSTKGSSCYDRERRLSSSPHL